MAFTHRLIFTHRCNAKCPHCFNINDRHLLQEDQDMDYDKLEKYLNLNALYISTQVAKIMGGEPTIHHRFIDMMKLVTSKFRSASIFTNGLQSSINILTSDAFINDMIMRGQIGLTFNCLTFNDIKWLEYISPNGKLFDGRNHHQISIHFVVNERNAQFLLNKMKRIVRTYPPQYFKIILSADVGADVFNKENKEKYKSLWIGFLKEARAICGSDRKFAWDHAIPLCFFDDATAEAIYTLNNIPVFNKCTCYDYCSGLIDPDFSIWFCNQFRYKVGNVFENPEKPLIFTEIDQLLRDARPKKTELMRNAFDECKTCPVVDYCKGGCFCNQLLKKN